MLERPRLLASQKQVNATARIPIVSGSLIMTPGGSKVGRGVSPVWRLRNFGIGVKIRKTGERCEDF